MAAREAVEKKLYDAASKGDVASFQQLVQEDSYLLNEASFACSRNLLHVATVHGQAAIVEEVLKRNPRLARILDSQNLAALHIAAEEGDSAIASMLLSSAPEMRWCRDGQGMNPVHIAAIHGHDRILEVLLCCDPFPAMERVHRGQTVLHLCVKHGQLPALMVLAEKLGELVCAKDDDGETLLHLAVRCKQLEMIRYLVKNDKIEKQTTNSMGKTPLEILREIPSAEREEEYLQIERMLMSLSDESILKIVPKMSDMTMVVMVLIATMAFQAASSPPGGVLQGDMPSQGVAVMTSTHPKIYIQFLWANTTAFYTSLVTIILIATRLPSRCLLFLPVTLCAMFVSLAAIAISFWASVIVTADLRMESIPDVENAVLIVFVAIGIPLIAILASLAATGIKRWNFWKKINGLQRHLT